MNMDLKTRNTLAFLKIQLLFYSRIYFIENY